MTASPSIRQIASSLAQPSRPTQPNSVPQEPMKNSSPMRTLAMRLDHDARRHPNRERLSATRLAEAFLKFSPRVQFREPNWVFPNWIFIEISSTSHFFLGEGGLMESAMALSRDLGFSCQCAIADTPAGAQAFAIARPQSIVPRGEERDHLKDLSLPLLLELEGLKNWSKPTAVESIISFFMMLGFTKIGDLSRFTFASFQERWSETGALLWRRIHAQDRQVISPLLPTEPLEDFVHFDFPISLVSLLLHQIQKSIDFLFARLQGRRLFAQKLTLILHCEYSSARHTIEIAPNVPSRSREIFMTLLENRLNGLNLENPVRDVEIAAAPCPENARQLDFFEPRTTAQDKLQGLFSLLLQSQIQTGFYKVTPSPLPEHAWHLTTEFPRPLASDRTSDEFKYAPPMQQLSFVAEVDSVLDNTADDVSGDLSNDSFGDGPATSAGDELGDAANDTPNSVAIAPEPWYGESVMEAPRPTRMLREPRLIPFDELRRLKILSTSPIERIEAHWWGECARRDYFFAVSPDGQCLWIFRDANTEEYYLHGYFD